MIGALLQLLAFTAIPAAVYAIGRRREGLAAYLGLRWPPPGALLLGLLAGAGGAALAGLAIRGTPWGELLGGPSTPAGGLSGRSGVDAVAHVFARAVIQTGIAEEILFRGFVARRAFAWLGFARGNLLQAAIFAAVHGIVLVAVPAAVPAAPLVLGLPFVAALLLGWINERRGGGSIVPGMVAHASGNAVAMVLLAG